MAFRIRQEGFVSRRKGIAGIKVNGWKSDLENAQFATLDDLFNEKDNRKPA
jgi:hypothetical protein